LRAEFEPILDRGISSNWSPPGRNQNCRGFSTKKTWRKKKKERNEKNDRRKMRRNKVRKFRLVQSTNLFPFGAK
jgi:hypothetical protein